MALPVEKLAESVRAGDVRAVSRAITAIENHQPEAEALLRLLFPHTGQAYLTGVTGAPGTGKSTLVDRLAAFHRRKHEQDRKSTRLNSSHLGISYAVFCLKKKKKNAGGRLPFN